MKTAGGWNRAGGSELAAYRHRGGMNVGFLDGHAFWFSPAGRMKWKP
ncbi:MAG: hypothetical protein IT210_09105 [Armatimonadetes bacterium]|nr:hypothetical protein [Armatimonadota bacterium]